VAGDPNLRVVYKELPILSDWSDKAARLSLVAAQAGKFGDFHRALYGSGAPSEAKMQAVADQLGLDPSRTASPVIVGEIEGNIDVARALRMGGTPTFVVGDAILSGAVGYQALKDAVDKARVARRA
jgi:protein-disulfide isomerase